MPQQIELLIVDPQHDFCDPAGALYVRGADKDVARLASFIRNNGSKLADITVTLDSHHYINVTHTVFWRGSDGNSPAPFTAITSKEIESGRWKPGAPSAKLRQLVLDRLKAMEAQGHTLFVWPPHCVIGTQGHNIVPDLRQAIGDWECREFATVCTVTKGSNPFVDWRSAFQAVVPDPQDPTTHPNTFLIEKLLQADLILIAGVPGSHTVAQTIRDIAREMQDSTDLRKLVWLTDAISPIPGFEKTQVEFVREMMARRMRVASTTTLDL